MKQKNKVTCSFSMNRDIYDAYKSIVTTHGENVKGNIIKYMMSVIKYETPNAETIEAMEEAERMKGDPNKKTYDSFEEIMKELENE